MIDPTLRFLAYLAYLVLGIDVLLLIGALLLSSILLRYRRGITLWYEQIKYLNKLPHGRGKP